MTSLMAWVGIDSRGPSSVYLASDSRISWDSNSVWDNARKLFASSKHPEVLSYCGDVLFPSQVLGQLTDMIDMGLLLDLDDDPSLKWIKLTQIIKDSLANYPKRIASAFTIAYCTRQFEGMDATFHMFKIRWSPRAGWTSFPELSMPQVSGLIDSFGSGAKSIAKWNSYWQNTSERRTSRSMYGAFCDALSSGDDPRSGGAPQLVGLYRKDAAKTFGVIFHEQCYVLGVPVTDTANLHTIEWRNELFERCDGYTRQKLGEAQPHKRPKGLGKT